MVKSELAGLAIGAEVLAAADGAAAGERGDESGSDEPGTSGGGPSSGGADDGGGGLPVEGPGTPDGGGDDGGGDGDEVTASGGGGSLRERLDGYLTRAERLMPHQAGRDALSKAVDELEALRKRELELSEDQLVRIAIGELRRAAALEPSFETAHEPHQRRGATGVKVGTRLTPTLRRDGQLTDFRVALRHARSAYRAVLAP
ncbi:MAG: hypothetical protein SFZ24_06500 [Planctomycetota bacterium]|nr:hypothetical protein [Planctomycetota bacterium]